MTPFPLVRLDAGPGGRAAAELLMPEDSPLFAGHFPGRPVLPGVAHLALVQKVIESLAAAGGGGKGGEGERILEVSHLRFRRPVEPGERLGLTIMATDRPGGIRFEIGRVSESGGAPGERVSEGEVRTGRPARAPEPISGHPGGVSATLGRPHAGLSPAAGLLPHEPPARLLVEIRASAGEGITCTCSIPKDHPLAAASGAPGFMALELAAQAAAAREALLRRAVSGGVRVGYLVGAREARLSSCLPVDANLLVTAACTGRAGPLCTYSFEVSLAGACSDVLAAGTISTFLPDVSGVG